MALADSVLTHKIGLEILMILPHREQLEMVKAPECPHGGLPKWAPAGESERRRLPF
jgi:hypothetical protein